MARDLGGDLIIKKKIDVTMGEAIPVAKSSFDPGYELGNSLEYCNKADLTRGYSDNGKAVGE